MPLNLPRLPDARLPARPDPVPARLARTGRRVTVQRGSIVGRPVVTSKIKKPVIGPPPAGSPGAPAPTAPVANNPYALPSQADLKKQYPGYDDGQLAQIFGSYQDQTQHQRYTNETVAPWLSAGLARLGGIQTNLGENYKAGTGIGAEALRAVAAAQPGQVAGTAGGMAVSSPTSYESTALGMRASAQGAYMKDIAEQQAYVAGMNQATLSQGYLNSLADYAKGLPAAYVEKRRVMREKIDAFRFQQEQFAEQKRAARVGEATSELNARTNAAIGFAQLGQSGAKLAADLAPQAATAIPEPPTGYVNVPTDDGGYETIRDRTYTDPSSASGGSTARDPNAPRSPNKISGSVNQSERFLDNGGRGFTLAQRRKIRAIGGQPVKWEQANDGRWYGRVLTPKAGAASGASGPTPAPATAASLAAALTEEYRGVSASGTESGNGGIEGTNPNDPAGAGQDVAEWVLGNRKKFTRLNGTVDIDKIEKVIFEATGGSTTVTAEAIKALLRQVAGRGNNVRWRG